MSVAQYLSAHAEPDTQANYKDLCNYLDRTPFKHRPVKNILVVPAYNEPLDFVDTLCQSIHLIKERTILIVVANVPDNASSRSVQRTKKMLQHLRTSKMQNLFVIDRVTNPIPRKQGVGLARKIGNDLTLMLWHNGRLESPWIYQTDADAHLPHNYFRPLQACRGAVVFAHQHLSDDPQLEQAAELYDLHMAYYVAAIKHMGSLYAYPTLGSTVVVHAEDYARVRGFPKRNAAEDFYLLNKLAKLHPITIQRNVTVGVQARASHRVPFGTGPALKKIVQEYISTGKSMNYTSYNWNCFELLGQALTSLTLFAKKPKQPLATNQTTAILDRLGMAKVANNIASKYQSVERRDKALSDWFDGFRTLRFIHEARSIYADQPLLQTLRKIPESVRLDTLQGRDILPIV